MKKDGAFIRAYDLETVSQAATRANLSKSWVYYLIQEDQLDWYEIGGRKLVHRRDVDALIRKRVG